jgi:hypothetical protein
MCVHGWLASVHASCRAGAGADRRAAFRSRRPGRLVRLAWRSILFIRAGVVGLVDRDVRRKPHRGSVTQGAFVRRLAGGGRNERDDAGRGCGAPASGGLCRPADVATSIAIVVLFIRLLLPRVLLDARRLWHMMPFKSREESSLSMQATDFADRHNVSQLGRLDRPILRHNLVRFPGDLSGSSEAKSHRLGGIWTCGGRCSLHRGRGAETVKQESDHRAQIVAGSGPIDQPFGGCGFGDGHLSR